jgi:hypothetical protein
MTTEHPITPPPELVQQWYDNMGPDPGPFESFAIAAARWGADQELEACCKLLELSDSNTREFLYSARRPKPPSLKDEVGKIINWLIEGNSVNNEDAATLRRALESLPD